MQGYIIIDSGEATETVCKQCYDNGITFKVNTKDWIFLGSDFKVEVPCYTCDTVIDGVEEKPKPHSWTVTVEVVVYHSEDEDLYTESDARDRVESALYDEFGDVRIVDSVEHFE